MPNFGKKHYQITKFSEQGFEFSQLVGMAAMCLLSNIGRSGKIVAFWWERVQNQMHISKNEELVSVCIDEKMERQTAISFIYILYKISDVVFFGVTIFVVN